MAVETPAFANQSGGYTAEQSRRAIFAAYARTAANSPGIIAGGLLSTADLQLTAPGSGMSVNVSTGECIIGGSEGGAQGGYYARGTSTTNLSIAAANATNPRIDTVCATISDAGYTEPTGGSGNQWTPQVVTGTATATASLANLLGAAALPLSSLLLGYVLVPATAVNIITADIANKATVVNPQIQGAPQIQGSLTVGSISWASTAGTSLGGSWTGFTAGTYMTASSAGLTVTRAGVYLVLGGWVWDSGATGQRAIFITKNNVNTANSTVAQPGSSTVPAQQTSDFVPCVVGDVLGLMGGQNSGGSVTISSANARAMWISY
jgi:hypothetical protein